MKTRRSRAAGSSLARTLGMFVALAITTVAGCAAVGPEAEPGSESADSRSDGDGVCGSYAERTECNPDNVINYIGEHQEESSDAIYDCIDCAAGLVEAGIASKVGGSGKLKLLKTAYQLYNYLSTAHDCSQCVDYVVDTGVLNMLSCSVSPCQYSEEANLADCQSSCGTIGEYGFISQGTTMCNCTPFEQEAICRLDCPDDQGYHVNGECYCEQEAPPEPPPPPPDCTGGDDGYSCPSDPDTGMDRACCGGACVVWECSACDWENPYCGG